MTYRANNIAQANPMTKFLQILESDMTNVGWVNVASQIAANYTSNGLNTASQGSNANTAQTNVQILVDVFKSPAANNGIANDWYVYIATDQTTNCILYMTMSQAFNTSTNLVTNYPLANQTGSTLNVYANQFCTNANTTNLFFTDMRVSGANCANGSNARVFCVNTGYMANTVNSNGMNYHYSVTIDRLVISLSNVQNMNGNTTTLYVGMYDSFMPLSIDQYPLLLANIATIVTESISTNYQGMYLTEPVYAANSAANIGTAGNFLTYISYAWSFVFSSSGHDSYLANTAPFSRMVILGWGGSPVSTTGARGLLRDCMLTTLVSGHGDQAYWNFNGTNYQATNLGLGTANWTTAVGGGYGPWLLQV